MGTRPLRPPRYFFYQSSNPESPPGFPTTGSRSTSHHTTGVTLSDSGLYADWYVGSARWHSVRFSHSNEESRRQPCRRTGWTGASRQAEERMMATLMQDTVHAKSSLS